MQEESRGLVLVVEDEKNIADVERLYLTRAGYGVHVEADGRAGLAAARSLRPVAVVLDVGLPTLDGAEVCRALRADGDWTPVLFVTCRDDEVDRVLGPELGGDDYITKPFSPRELVARVKSVLRRTAGPAGADRVLTVGQVSLDPGRRRVSAQGHEVDADSHRVRPAGGAPASAWPGAHPGGAAERGVGVRGGCRHAHRGRARRPAAGEAGCGEPGADGPRRGLLRGRVSTPPVPPGRPGPPERQGPPPTPPTPRTPRRRMRLSRQAALVTLAVASVAVLLTGAVAFGLVRGAGEGETHRVLGRQADQVAAVAERTTGPGRRAGEAALRVLLGRRANPAHRDLLRWNDVAVPGRAPHRR